MAQRAKITTGANDRQLNETIGQSGQGLPDDSGMPVGHPQAQLIFESFDEGQYKLRPRISH